MDWIKLDSDKLENGMYFVALKDGEVKLSEFTKAGTVNKNGQGKEYVVKENIWSKIGYGCCEYNYEESDILYVLPYPTHPDKEKIKG